MQLEGLKIKEGIFQLIPSGAFFFLPYTYIGFICKGASASLTASLQRSVISVFLIFILHSRFQKHGGNFCEAKNKEKINSLETSHLKPRQEWERHKAGRPGETKGLENCFLSRVKIKPETGS